MACFTTCPPCAGCEELRRKAAAAEATLDLVRGIVAEMRDDATQPKGGQSVGPRRMPVALSIILELERAMGPGRGEYAAQAYFDLTARVEALEVALRDAARAIEAVAGQARLAAGHLGATPYQLEWFKNEIRSLEEPSLAAVRSALSPPSPETKDKDR